MRFGGLPMFKSTPKKFWAPKKNSILGEKKFFIDDFRKIEKKISPKIGFFFGAHKIFWVDLSPGRPPNRIFGQNLTIFSRKTFICQFQCVKGRWLTTYGRYKLEELAENKKIQKKYGFFSYLWSLRDSKWSFGKHLKGSDWPEFVRNWQYFHEKPSSVSPDV